MKNYPPEGCQKALVLFLLAGLLLLPGCSYLARQPLETLSYINPRTATHRNLFVFMRGLGGSHRTFAEEGMVDVTWQRGIPFDMVAPNAHFAYYSEETLLGRLREDVILPAKERGYDHIWLVGASMGGLGSLLYAREHPEDIQGVCLLSPFLGDEAIIAEINRSGGLRQWAPGSYLPEEDWQRMLWHWLQTEVIQGRTPPVYLSYGNSDMYVEAQKVLAAALPPSQVTTRPGGHDYATFKALWLSFLDRDVYLPSRK